MITINNLFDNRKYEFVKSRRTERGDLLTEFASMINATRTGKYKPLSLKTYGFYLSPYTTSELYFLLKKCNSSKNFAATFWWTVKPKKV